jgi:hypothetical protein
MFQSEALWISFEGRMLQRSGTPYPFAVKVAAGSAR